MNIIPQYHLPETTKYLLILFLDKDDAWLFWKDGESLNMVSGSVAIAHTRFRWPFLIILEDFHAEKDGYSGKLKFYFDSDLFHGYYYLDIMALQKFGKVIAMFNGKVNYDVALEKTVYDVLDAFDEGIILKIGSQRKAGLNGNIDLDLLITGGRFAKIRTLLTEKITVKIPHPSIQYIPYRFYSFISDIHDWRRYTQIEYYSSLYFNKPIPGAVDIFLLADRILELLQSKK